VWPRQRISLAHFKSCNCSEVPQLIPLLFPFSLFVTSPTTAHSYITVSLLKQPVLRMSIVPNAQLDTFNCHTHSTAHKLLLCHILPVFTGTEAVSKFKNPDYQLATHSIFHSFSSNSLYSSLFDAPVRRLNTLPQTARTVTVPTNWTHADRCYQFSSHTAQLHALTAPQHHASSLYCRTAH
jgi:hypothetical protein